MKSLLMVQAGVRYSVEKCFVNVQKRSNTP